DVGGLVDESSATLCVYGDDLEPAELSALLGVEPSRSFRRGHRQTPDSRPAGHGAWFLRVEGTAPFGPNEHLGELLRRLPANPVVWSELRARYQVRISIGIHFDAWNRGFALDAATLAQV